VLAWLPRTFGVRSRARRSSSLRREPGHRGQARHLSITRSTSLIGVRGVTTRTPPCCRWTPTGLTVTTAIGLSRRRAQRDSEAAGPARYAFARGPRPTSTIAGRASIRRLRVEPPRPTSSCVGDANGSSVGKSGHFATPRASLVARPSARSRGEPENASPMLGNVCDSGDHLESVPCFTNHLIYRGGVMVPRSLVGRGGPTSGSNFERRLCSRLGTQPLGGLAHLMQCLHG